MAAVVLCGAPLAKAAADPISNAQAQIRALQGQIDASAARIHQLTTAYSQAAQAAAGMAQQVAADNAQLAANRSKVEASLAILRHEAVMSYTGAVGDRAPVVSTASAATSEISSEYLSATVGNVSDTVDQLRLQQRQVADAEAAVRADLAVEQRDLGAASSARESALAQANDEQAQLAGDQQRLSALQAAAAAAAARAAAQRQAAIASAQRQAAAQRQATLAAAQRQAALAAALPSARPAPQGLPVNGGLVVAVASSLNPPPASPPASTAPAPASGGGTGGVWLQLRECESSDNYQANTGNGFYGAYQFSASTWTGLGYPGRPDLEPPAMQDQAAMRLQAQYGWGQWPACSAALGLT